MTGSYYVLVNGVPYGPYSEEQMRLMAVQGQVNAATLVFQQGGKQQWSPASQFPVLFKKPQGKGFFAPSTGTSVPVSAGGIESTVWEGRPSLWLLFSRFLFPSLMLFVGCTLTLAERDNMSEQEFKMLLVLEALVLLVVMLAFLWQLAKLKSTSWKLTTERLCVKTGVFSHRVRNLELFRVKDIGLHKPFSMRLVGLGNVDYQTSDPTDKRGLLQAVHKPDEVFAALRKYVDRQRQLKGIREVDVHGV